MPYVVVVAFALACSCMIAGCGGGSGAVESKERAPEANVDPSRIDSGSYLADNGFGYSADVWYIDGDTSRPGFYLEAWTVVLPVFFDESGKPIDPDCDATIKDKHLVPSEECESGYDIVFVDPMTCYDSVSNTWYSRGDYNAVMAKVVNTKWKSLTNESIEIELREDGTLVESRDGKQAEAGTWPLPPSTRLACIGMMKIRRGTMPSIAIRTARPISSIGALTAAVTTHASTSGFLHKGDQGLLAYKAGSLLCCGVFARTAASSLTASAIITALP